MRFEERIQALEASLSPFATRSLETRGRERPEEPWRQFAGNRPSTTIVAPALTPSVLGQLIALYEHIVFTQGVVWGIDSFDQWGVELGKQLANAILPELTSAAALGHHDASTQRLITLYRERRLPE